MPNAVQDEGSACANHEQSAHFSTEMRVMGGITETREENTVMQPSRTTKKQPCECLRCTTGILCTNLKNKGNSPRTQGKHSQEVVTLGLLRRHLARCATAARRSNHGTRACRTRERCDRTHCQLEVRELESENEDTR